jgi:hypothetical protein
MGARRSTAGEAGRLENTASAFVSVDPSHTARTLPQGQRLKARASLLSSPHLAWTSIHLPTSARARVDCMHPFLRPTPAFPRPDTWAGARPSYRAAPRAGSVDIEGTKTDGAQIDGDGHRRGSTRTPMQARNRGERRVVCRRVIDTGPARKYRNICAGGAGPIVEYRRVRHAVGAENLCVVHYGVGHGAGNT